MTNIPTLKLQLKGLTADSALKCIRHRGAGDKVFYWDGSMQTPNTALKNWESCILNMPCGDVGVIRFFGGPPKNPTWYNGSVLSMLCDLIMFDEHSKELVESGESWLSA